MAQTAMPVPVDSGELQPPLSRARFHGGSHAEIQYALLTFGIPGDMLPVNLDGLIDLSNHVQWLQMRGWQEQHQSVGAAIGNPISSKSCQNTTTAAASTTTPAMTVVMVPGMHDVLMGRGSTVHYGNIRLRKIVDDVSQKYESSNLRQKTEIAESVVDQIKSVGGRFLKRKESVGAWVVMDDETARDKVSHRFRNIRKHGQGKDQARGKNKRKLEVLADEEHQPTTCACLGSTK